MSLATSVMTLPIDGSTRVHQSVGGRLIMNYVAGIYSILYFVYNVKLILNTARSAGRHGDRRLGAHHLPCCLAAQAYAAAAMGNGSPVERNRERVSGVPARIIQWLPIRSGIAERQDRASGDQLGGALWLSSLLPPADGLLAYHAIAAVHGVTCRQLFVATPVVCSFMIHQAESAGTAWGVP